MEQKTIKHISIHLVGNKSAEDGVVLSKSNLVVNDEINSLLVNYFLAPFSSEEYFQLYHDSGIEYNVVYGAVSKSLTPQKHYMTNP